MIRQLRTEPYVVTYREGLVGRQRTVQWGSDLVVGGNGIRGHLTDVLPSDASDLMIITASLYAVDRMVARPRGRSVGQYGDWSRDLDVQIPILEPDRWTPWTEDLRRLLRWLTDDNWDLTFSQCRPKRGPFDQEQGILFGTVPTGTWPILFSGGLDSACAVYNALYQQDIFTVSVHTNSWMQNTQHVVGGMIGERAGNRLSSLSFRACLPAGGSETSQRTRGLLFLASGAMAAIAAGSDGLVVGENGIGAINLPYVPSQHGAQATRSMHPQTIRMVSDLVSNVTGRPFTIDTPYMHLTKAELVGRTNASADGALAHTVSCDKGFSARVRGRMPCGECTSCILRRQAVEASRRPLVESGQRYRTPSPANAPAFSAMAWQAHRLGRCLASSDPWGAMLDEFPALVHISGLVTREQTLRLYDQYTTEFARYLRALGVVAMWT